MTLHEAIKNVLLNFGKLSVKEITDKVNSHRLYKRKDGQLLNSTQISARIAKYPELFTIDQDNRVILRNYSLISLKLTIDKIADTLYLSPYETTQVSELLLPVFAIYLKFSNPFNLFRSFENANTSATDFFSATLLEELKIINETNQFKGLISRQIEAFENLDNSLKLKIVMNILDGIIHIKKAKYFTERKTSYEFDSFDEYLDNETDIQSILESVSDYQQRFTEFASWNVPEHDFISYFNKLVNEFSWKKRFQSLQSTPISLARVISAIIQSEEFTEDTEYIFIDPFIGKGSLMAEVCLENSARNISIYGGDLSGNAIAIAKLLFAVNGLKQPIVYEANAFTDWEKLSSVADWFICDPPMMQKLNLDIPLFGGYGSVKNSTEAVINMALYHSHENGKACIIVPESFIFSSTKSTMALRKKLVDNNFLDGIISLPAGLYAPYSSVKTSLIIIDKSRKNTGNNRVFIYDASKVKPDELETVIPEIKDRYAEKGTQHFSSDFFIKKERIAEQDYDFSIQKFTVPLLLESTLLNYLPIAELLPIMQSGVSHTQPSIFSGNSIKKEDLSFISGIPYVQISDLSNDPFNCYLREDKIRTYLESTEYMNPRFLKKGAVLIAKTGNNLKPTIYEGETNILFSTSILGFSLDTSKIHPHYFILQLHKEYFIDQLTKIKRGITVLSFKPEDFLKLLVHVPSLEEQKNILQDQTPSWNKNNVSREDISNLIGELKHKSKGPLGGIKLSVTRLENYLSDKRHSGEKIHEDDIAYMIQSGQIKEDYLQYSVQETFKRIYQHIERIDDYFKKAIQFANLGTEPTELDSIDLYKLINTEIIPSNQYNFQISINVRKQDRHVLVKGNKDRLLSVFELFLDNAFIHGFKSRPDKSSRVNISWQIKGGESLTQKTVFVNIENNGVPAKDLTVERFITKGHTTNSGNGGLGMGGAFIHKALSLMGGQLVSIEDISQKTSEFNIQFIFKLVGSG